MPRYFFHVRDGLEYLDDEGTELDDLAAVQRHSLRVAAELLGDPDSGFWNGEDWHLQVEDDAGLELFQLSFKAVMSSEPDSGSSSFA